MGGGKAGVALVLCCAGALAARPLEVTVGAQGPDAVVVLGHLTRAALSADVPTPPVPSEGGRLGVPHYDWRLETSEWRGCGLVPWQAVTVASLFASPARSDTELRVRLPRAGEWRLQVGVTVTWLVDGQPQSGHGGVTLLTRVVDTHRHGRPSVKVARVPHGLRGQAAQAAAPHAAPGLAGALGLFGATTLGANSTTVSPSGDGNDVQVDVSVSGDPACSLDGLTLTIASVLRPERVVYSGDVRWSQCVQAEWQADGSWSSTWRVTFSSLWSCCNEEYSATAVGEFRDWTGWQGGPWPAVEPQTDAQTLTISNLVLRDVSVDLGGDDYFVYDPRVLGDDGQPRVPRLSFTLSDGGCTTYWTGTEPNRTEHDYRYRYTVLYENGLVDQGYADWHSWQPTTAKVTGYATLGTAVKVSLTPGEPTKPLVGGYRLLVEEVTQDAEPSVADSQVWHESDYGGINWPSGWYQEPLSVSGGLYLQREPDGSHSVHVSYGLYDQLNVAPAGLNVAVYGPDLASEATPTGLSTALGYHDWNGSVAAGAWHYGLHTLVVSGLDGEGALGWPPSRRDHQNKFSYPVICRVDAPQPRVKLRDCSLVASAWPNPVVCGQDATATASPSFQQDVVGEAEVDGTDYVWSWSGHGSTDSSAVYRFGWDEVGPHTLTAHCLIKVHYHWSDYQGRHDETASSDLLTAEIDLDVRRFGAPSIGGCQLSAPAEAFVGQPFWGSAYGWYTLDEVTQQAVNAGVAHVEERYAWVCADFDKLAAGGQGQARSVAAERDLHARGD